MKRICLTAMPVLLCVALLAGTVHAQQPPAAAAGKLDPQVAKQVETLREQLRALFASRLTSVKTIEQMNQRLDRLTPQQVVQLADRTRKQLADAQQTADKTTRTGHKYSGIRRHRSRSVRRRPFLRVRLRRGVFDEYLARW